MRQTRHSHRNEHSSHFQQQNRQNIAFDSEISAENPSNYHDGQDEFPSPRSLEFASSQETYDFATYRPETGRNPRTWVKFLRTGLIVAACLGLLIFSGWKTLAENVFAPSSGDLNASNSASQSTPIAEWKQGTIPYLYQIDPAWSQTPYAGSTIGVAGCGPTCLSMVTVSLTGRRDLDPVSLAAFSEGNGYVMDGLTSWDLMTSGADQLGLYGEAIPADASMVHRLLSQGYPIIASMLPGDFTTEGHFIVLAGIAKDGTSVVVHDPNSPERSNQTWDIDTILTQCANLWAYSLA